MLVGSAETLKLFLTARECLAGLLERSDDEVTTRISSHDNIRHGV